MNVSLDGTKILNQDILREVEALCIQEEPPGCTAACPVHVDAKAFIAKIRKGDWAGAYKQYTKAVSFPRIIANICDAPCQGACRRQSLGGSIEIQELEKAVLTKVGGESKAPLFLPKKTQKVLVVGGGLSGLAAACDMAKKGYKVTLAEEKDTLGGRLLEVFDLPEEALQQDIADVLKLPITVQYGEKVKCDTEDDILGIMETKEFSAVFIACDTPLLKLADEKTTKTPAGNILVRIRQENGKPSYISDLMLGRSAATSIDRMMQNVSIEAGREKEGSYETRLYTNTDGICEEKPVAPSQSGYTEEEALAEASRCIQCECMECVKKCAFMQKYKSHPRRYVREVYNNLSIAMGNHHANGMINNCALCSRCEAVCPNGLNMKEVFLAARQNMTKTEKMPVSAYEFATLDMEYSMSDAFFMARHQPGTKESKYLFFPGCQLCASEPELAERTYSDLTQRLSGGVGLMLSCCGILAYWAGNEEKFQEAVTKIQESWKQMGEPVVITACPSCMDTLAKHAGIPVEGIWETLSGLGIPDVDLQNIIAGESRDITVHHACGARYNEEVQNQILDVARAVGLDPKNSSEPASHSPCCGYGGAMPFADRDMADAITKEALVGEQGKILTYCVNCRDRYIEQGAEAFHILEFVYGGEGLRRRMPTWSQRQENRASFKSQLLETLWGETFGEVSSSADGGTSSEGLRNKLVFSQSVEEKLDRNKILLTDVAKVIAYSEESGKFVNTKNNHFLGRLPLANVTYWVEYSIEKSEQGGEDDSCFRVHNAYSHRIAIDEKDYGFSGKAQEEALEGSEDWTCACGDKELIPRSISLNYMGNGFQANMPCCPECGLVFVSEGIAKGRMLHVEKSLEDK